SAAVGDGGVVIARSPPDVISGDEHIGRGGADRDRLGRAVAVPLQPQLLAGGGVVGQRGVVGREAGALALPGDEHRLPGRADRHRVGIVVAVDGTVVAGGPQLLAGGGVVGHRGVVVAYGVPVVVGRPVARPGDEHLALGGAGDQRLGHVVLAGGAVVASDP